MVHWTIWGREPGVDEASLRRYGSKLVYHSTVYFLFTLVTVTCKYSTLTLLTYHFANYNSCSNWRPPTSMQTGHARTRFCRTLTNIPDVFWIISQAATVLATNSINLFNKPEIFCHSRWVFLRRWTYSCGRPTGCSSFSSLIQCICGRYNKVQMAQFADDTW